MSLCKCLSKGVANKIGTQGEWWLDPFRVRPQKRGVFPYSVRRVLCVYARRRPISYVAAISCHAKPHSSRPTNQPHSAYNKGPFRLPYCEPIVYCKTPCERNVKVIHRSNGYLQSVLITQRKCTLSPCVCLCFDHRWRTHKSHLLSSFSYLQAFSFPLDPLGWPASNCVGSFNGHGKEEEEKEGRKNERKKEEPKQAMQYTSPWWLWQRKELANKFLAKAENSSYLKAAYRDRA